MGDDFSDAVKKVLASRVGTRCSNPDCRALTSGPQDDPRKAVNLGVAAHITAASPGGPRYDSDLLPEERVAPSNGIWLCQNCAKLVDNDPARFTVDLLERWKLDAEADARTRVGKTAVADAAPAFNLRVPERVRIEPIVPHHFEGTEWVLQSDTGTGFNFWKSDSQAQLEIPKSFIEKFHRFGDSKSAFLQLSGRVQWVTTKQHWELFPGKPAKEIGIGNDVDSDYPRRQGIVSRFDVAWCREDQLPRCLAEGCHVFYGDDGKYLRWPGPDVAQILVLRPTARQN